jgi:hypothetical protein
MQNPMELDNRSTLYAIGLFVAIIASPAICLLVVVVVLFVVDDMVSSCQVPPGGLSVG